MRDTDPVEPQALRMVTSKTPWPLAWPYRPRSLHPSYRWSCCSTYRWIPSLRVLRTSRGTSCPLSQSYPLCDRTTFLPLLWFTGISLPNRDSPQSGARTGGTTPIRSSAFPHSTNCLEEVFSETELPRALMLGNPELPLLRICENCSRVSMPEAFRLRGG